MTPETRSSSSVCTYLGHLRSWTVLLLLAGLCCVVELVLMSADLGFIGSTRWRGLAYQNGAFWAGLLDDWRPNYVAQPWLMFLSYSFLHGGLSHLAGNMLILVFLGPAVQARVGQWKLLAIYVLSAIGGAAGFALLGNNPQPVVGASGALFGLAGALVFWEFADHRREGRGLWPVASIVLVLIAMNVIFWVLLEGVLAWQTHLAGFVSGWLAAWMLKRSG
ncbi:rhomboid family intramembrane serine protease [Marimonas arenosa]|uniref:Rhomboid family intramembrane serine protease n=1 Tax=Marimonas arenosa TaxID=1795305 RepID=A0AAE3WDJ2_9RHOB|nr:rhomboid family intramembrane serine protease [Marimonas arenosa]MDQ2089653.1 rhomboid family intramembrane serine protease [Marimonas arenosa]